MQKTLEFVENPEPNDPYYEPKALKNRDQWRSLVAEFEAAKTDEYPFNPLAGDVENLGDKELLRLAMEHFNQDLSREARCMCIEFSG